MWRERARKFIGLTNLPSPESIALTQTGRWTALIPLKFIATWRPVSRSEPFVHILCHPLSHHNHSQFLSRLSFHMISMRGSISAAVWTMGAMYRRSTTRFLWDKSLRSSASLTSVFRTSNFRWKISICKNESADKWIQFWPFSTIAPKSSNWRTMSWMNIPGLIGMINRNRLYSANSYLQVKQLTYEKNISNSS